MQETTGDKGYDETNVTKNVMSHPGPKEEEERIHISESKHAISIIITAPSTLGSRWRAYLCDLILSPAERRKLNKALNTQLVCSSVCTLCGTQHTHTHTHTHKESQDSMPFPSMHKVSRGEAGTGHLTRENPSNSETA